MKTKFIISAAFATMLFACNNHLPDHMQANYSGLIITEVAANADKLLADSWVEIHNTSSREIDLTGLGLFLYDERGPEAGRSGRLFPGADYLRGGQPQPAL